MASVSMEDEDGIKELVQDLEQFCQSDALSLEGIQEKIKGIPSNAVHKSLFFHHICYNKYVTLEIVECLLSCYPAVVRACIPFMSPPDRQNSVYPLHVACINSNAPNEVIELLVEKNPSALQHWSCFYYSTLISTIVGLPLHFYLRSTCSVNLQTVKFMVRRYPESLTAADDELLFTPLYTILVNQNVNDLCYMLEYFAETSPLSYKLLDTKQRTPLHIACTNKCIKSNIVKILLDIWPESISERDSDGYFPIHLLFDYFTNYNNDPSQLDIGTVKMLARAFPEALCDHVNFGKHNPIGYLLCNPSIDNLHQILDFIIEFRPSSLQLADGHGRTPLHIACLARSPSKRLIELLYNLWSDSISRATIDGYLPLHNLCVNSRADGGDLEILRLLLAWYPDATGQHTQLRGLLPIHIAAEYKSDQFCNILIEANPDSLMIRTTGAGDLPTHLCSGFGRLDTLKVLLELSPESIFQRNALGLLPIHTAVVSNQLDKVDYLLKTNSDLASEMAMDGFLPLHLACRGNFLSESNERKEIMMLLFDAFPEALFIRSGDGRTPMEYAAANERVTGFFAAQLVHIFLSQNRKVMNTFDHFGQHVLHNVFNGTQEGYADISLGAIKLLVQANPAALQASDFRSRYPLHFACEFGTASAVRYFLQIYDGCLDKYDSKEDYPLHYACRGGNYEVVNYLLEKPMKAVSEKNIDNKLPIHLLCESGNNSTNQDNQECYVEAIWKLLRAYPDVVVNW